MGSHREPDHCRAAYLTPQDMPVGKMLDLLITKTRTPRPRTEEGSLSLVCLVALPDQSRRAAVLDLAQSAAEVDEGSLVVLARAPK